MRLSVWLPISVLALTACDSSTAPTLTDLQVVTTVSPDNNAVKSLAIVTKVTNRSKRVVTITAGTCPARYRIETAAGEPVALADEICDVVLIRVMVAPGENYRFNEHWNGKDRYGAQLTGTYHVIGQPFSKFGPESAPVTIQLMP